MEPNAGRLLGREGDQRAANVLSISQALACSLTARRAEGGVLAECIPVDLLEEKQADIQSTTAGLVNGGGWWAEGTVGAVALQNGPEI